MSEAVERIGGGAVGFPGSADPAVADALIDSCVGEFGRVDLLVNCAGTPEPASSSILTITSRHSFTSCSTRTSARRSRRAGRRLRRWLLRAAAPSSTPSSFAFLGDYGGTGYPAGKGGVNGLTLAIAAELREHDVRANVVCPGAKTRISTGPDYEAQIADLNRRGLLDDVNAQGALDAPPPEYVAPTYAYLVSDRAKDVTGQILIAAGGFVGRFDRQTPSSSDTATTRTRPPWSLDELDGFIQMS